MFMHLIIEYLNCSNHIIIKPELLKLCKSIQTLDAIDLIWVQVQLDKVDATGETLDLLHMEYNSGWVYMLTSTQALPNLHFSTDLHLGFTYPQLLQLLAAIQAWDVGEPLVDYAEDV